MRTTLDIQAEGSRRAEERRVLWLVLWLNLLVAAIKLVAAAFAGSLALAADGIHSVLDSASNVVGLWGVRMAAAPPDAGHPYGHRKFEVIASLSIGVLIALAAVEIGRQVFGAFSAPRAPAEPTLIYIAALATLVVNAGVTRYESRKGHALRSPVLLADAAHTYSDLLATTLVLVSALLLSLGVPGADPIVGACVLVLVGRTAYRILREAIDVLVDSARLDEGQVRALVLGVPGVLAVTRVRSRGLHTAVELDLVLAVDGALSLHAAHRIADEVEATLRGALPEVTDIVVHVEPA